MTRLRFAWVVVAALLAAGALGLGASAVLGQVILTPTPNPLPGGSNFQGGDGDQADGNGHIDWQGLEAADRVRRQADLPEGSDDHFTSGSKENEPVNWVVTRGNLGSPSDDLLDIYRSFEHPTEGHAFLYLGGTRRAGTGTTFLSFELNQVAEPWTNPEGFPIPCRKTGDLLITFKMHGTTPTVGVDEWVTTNPPPGSDGCAMTGRLQPVTDLTPNVDVQAAQNTSAIRNYLPTSYPWVNQMIPANQFGEVAIDLTTVLHEVGEDCADSRFGSIWAHSRASDEASSALKDYVAPVPFLVRACKAEPTLSSQQGAEVDGVATTTARVPLRTPIFDTAILGPRACVGAEVHCVDQPTGTITFRLYGPNDRRCSRRPIFRSAVDADGGIGPYNSGSFTARSAGRYRWRVTYSGDANNQAAGPTGCQAEPVVITRVTPQIGTEASGTTVLPNPIRDTATLTGGIRPRGSINFKVFNPTDTVCASPVHTFTVPVRGNNTYTSPDFTPTEPGTWRWIATYSGDARNVGVSTHCGDPGEDVVVDPTPTPPAGKPGLTTAASPGGPAGSPITDTAAVLAGGVTPTGTITFYVYGPDDSNCTGSPAAPPTTVPVSGTGTYHSAPFTPTATGTYRWVAHYSGDAANDPAETSCGESGEISVVSAAHPSITTSAAPVTVPNGDAVGDTAALTGGSNPRGTITFRLYGPDDITCTGPPAFVVSQEVIGSGSYPSPMPAPALAGTYQWVATYSGDANNASVSTRCGDAGESVVVQPPPPTLQTPDEPTPKPKPKPQPKPRPKPKPRPPSFTG